VTPMDLTPFMNDPIWVVIVKALFAFVLLIVLVLFGIVFERKVLGRMQNRPGPKFNGPFGSLQSLADGIKSMLKEEITPGGADKVLFMLAPAINVIPVVLIFALLPMAGEVPLPGGGTTRLQVADMPISVLLILGITGIAVYGVVLAGWSSNSTFSLLGGMRASAQLISYEIAFGLSLVAVFMYAGTASTSEIVEAQGQANRLAIGSLEIPMPSWYALVLIPSFVIFVIAVFGESQRTPFDLPEGESEIVGGYLTEYSSMRFAMFYMAEYMALANASAIVTTIFLGGYNAIPPFNYLGMDHGYWGLFWFVLKTILFMFFMVWVRAAVPRFRYDQFMNLGWKWLIPLSLAWLMIVATFQVLTDPDDPAPRWAWVAVVIIFLAVIAAIFFFGGREERVTEEEPEREFDAFAGGFPVPPMPGQVLPELAGVVPAGSTRTEASTVDTAETESTPAESANGDS
jgi:NADH-quinone oxidoreductase subunit H